MSPSLAGGRSITWPRGHAARCMRTAHPQRCCLLCHAMPTCRTLLAIGLSAVLAKPYNVSAFAISQPKPKWSRAYHQMISHNMQILPHDDDAVSDVERRRAMVTVLKSLTCGSFALISGGSPCRAANLPTSTGADMSKTGTLEKLIPLVAMEEALMTAKQDLLKARDDSGVSADTIKTISKVLASSIPPEQTLFKRKFDEYSEPVSYKQKFMDQNAFLVYYTKGFDGPNRPPMESSTGPIPLQSIQYGLRNDAWTNYDELLSEISFFSPSDSSSTIEDILKPLDNCIASFEAYLSYSPAADVVDARRRVKQK